MKITGNEPAQPMEYSQEYGEYGQKEQIVHKGLTIRQEFARTAMLGLLKDFRQNGMYGNSIDYPMVHEQAVRCADALIVELNKTEP